MAHYPTLKWWWNRTASTEALVPSTFWRIARIHSFSSAGRTIRSGRRFRKVPNSYFVTVTLTVVFCEMLPEVAVMVIVELPTGVPGDPPHAVSPVIPAISMSIDKTPFAAEVSRFLCQHRTNPRRPAGSQHISAVLPPDAGAFGLRRVT